MSEWKKVRLGDVADVKGGKRLPSGMMLTEELTNHPYIRIRDLTDVKNLEITTAFQYVTDDVQQRISRYIVDEGDVLISIVGTVGLVSIVGRSLAGANLTENCVKIINLKGLDNNYLYYYLKSVSGQYQIRNLTVGAVQPKLPIANILSIQLPLPPLPTQRKIAAVLGALDDKIENNRKICANLEAQAQAIFKSWFVDFEPFGGKMPQGWKMGKLGDICSYISRGLTPKYVDSSNELILGQTCVRNNVVSLANARSHQLSKETVKKVHKWDTLINSTGIGSLGRVGIVYFDMPNVAFDSHLTVVRASDSIFNHYLGRNLLNRQSEIENIAVGSTGQTELPRDSVREMAMIIPTQPILEQFNEIIDPVGKRIYHSLLQNSRLAALRDALLPKLMSGEIDVEKVKVA